MELSVIRRSFDLGGGGERYAAHLVAALAGRGHRVTAVTEQAPRAWPTADGRIPEGVDLVELGTASGTAPRRLSAFARRLAKWLAKNRGRFEVNLSLERVPGADVWRAGEGVHLAWLHERRRYESPLKALSFGLNPLHRTHLRLERDLVRRPSLRRIVANSERVRRDLTELYNVDPDRIAVVPTGVNRARLDLPDRERAEGDIRAELGLGSRPMVLFVGAGFRRKGLAWAIRALAEMDRPEAVLVVAGRDRLEPFRRLARGLGLDNRVFLLGHREDVGALLAAADAFVLPTMYDPQSGACLEALAAGVPVVTTEANGVADFIVDGEGGFLVSRADDVTGLAGALDQALDLGPVRVAVPTLDKHLDRLTEVLREASRD